MSMHSQANRSWRAARNIRRFLEGEPPEAIIDALVGLPLAPATLHAILAGCGLPHPRVFGVVRKGRPIAIGPGATGDSGDGGSSLLEADQVDTCKELLAKAGDRLVLPEDITALGPGGKLFDPDAGGEVRQAGTSLIKAKPTAPPPTRNAVGH